MDYNSDKIGDNHAKVDMLVKHLPCLSFIRGQFGMSEWYSEYI